VPDKPVWTMDQIIPALTGLHEKWYTAPIAFSFYEAAHSNLSPKPPNFSPLGEVQRLAVREAFRFVADITPLTFVEVADQAGEQPWIRFFNLHMVAQWSGSADNRVNEAYEPDAITGSDIAFNLYMMNQRGFYQLGDWKTMIIMHEVLHALGLSHPGPYNGPGYNYQDHALYAQDTTEFTVMSYWTADNSGADHVAGAEQKIYRSAAPLLHDIAALQHLYGANMATRAGDTVYGFNSTAGRAVYDIAQNAHPVFSIWDGGGNDTLDLSGFASRSRIDLAPGAFSDADGMTRNLSIAFGVTIENAKGGAGADRISGNSAANRIEGGGGTDWLDGGAGGDTFVFASLADSHIYQRRSDGKKYAPDLISDFKSGEDRIDVSGIDAVWGTPQNDAFELIGAAAFSGRAGELRWEVGAGIVHVFGDVDGDLNADLLILLRTDSIAAGDFIV